MDLEFWMLEECDATKLLDILHEFPQCEIWKPEYIMLLTWRIYDCLQCLIIFHPVFFMHHYSSAYTLFKFRIFGATLWDSHDSNIFWKLTVQSRSEKSGIMISSEAWFSRRKPHIALWTLIFSTPNRFVKFTSHVTMINAFVYFWT